MIVLAASSLWPFSHHTQASTSSYRIPAWDIHVVRDRFTGESRCALTQGARGRPELSYSHGAVAFQFAHRLSTTKASFKIDDGPVRSWSSIYPELVETGATLEGRSLDNPTGGKVLLPLMQLIGAHTVTIRPTLRARPRLFSVDGLSGALATAKNLGCDAKTGFGS